MDPITGIGLAASVIQLVTFGISAAKTCRGIYKQGGLGDDSQVDYVAKHLASRIVSMQQSLRNSNTQSLVLSREEQELVDLSRRCENCALELQHETIRLQTKPRTSIVLAASKAVRALWEKNSIEKIQRELESYHYSVDLVERFLPNLEKHSTSRAAPANVSWKIPDQSPDTIRGDTLFRRSICRQALGKRLQWEVGTQVKLSPDDQIENHPLVENYIFCCCEPTAVDLARILLKAGANPIVRVRPMYRDPKLELPKVCSFWESWLHLLQEMRRNYMIANGKSGGLLLDKRHLNQPVTLGDIFVVTKALLAHGADIDHQIKGFSGFTKRRGLFDNRFPYELEFSAPAMFLLEECLNKEPEFRTFAVAVRPLIKTPTRRILRIYGPENYPKDSEFNSSLAIHLPSADESKLWPFVTNGKIPEIVKTKLRL